MKARFEMEKLQPIERELFSRFLSIAKDSKLPPPFVRMLCGLVVQQTQPDLSRELLASINDQGLEKVAFMLRVVSAAIEMVHATCASKCVKCQDDTCPWRGKEMTEDERIFMDTISRWVVRKFEDYLPGVSEQPERLLQKPDAKTLN